MLNALRRSAEVRTLSERLNAGISARARAPVFYAGFGVADTIDGRFDMLALHAALVMECVEGDLAQALVDTIFVSFDEALRQQGAGDVGMSRRMKKMAEAFFGRVHAYREARDAGALEAAIARNIYRGRSGPAAALAAYALSAREHAAKNSLDAGEIDFGPLPVPEE
jgi:cytochrome b pre-mRNA-processing protein 3